MGWVRQFLSRFQRRSSRRPAWVSPQFLSVVAGLGLVASGYVLWTYGDPSESSPAASGGLKREYVGLDERADTLPPGLETPGCALACQVDRLVEAWDDRHPDAEVVSKTPVYKDGQLRGYWITYEGGDP